MAAHRVPTDRQRLKEVVVVPPYGKRVLTDYQREWLNDHFRDKENSKIMELMNLSHSTLHRMVRKMKLTKSEAGMRAIKKRQAAHIKKVCTENGYYDSLRGKKPSEAALESTRRLRESGFNPIARLKEKSPYRYKKWLEKKTEARRKLVRDERRRMVFGLEPKTKLGKMMMRKQFTHNEVSFRHNMLKQGYILGDLDPENGERWTIFYDTETARSAIREQHAVERGFKILPLPENE